MLVQLDQWEKVRDRFSEEEKAKLNLAVSGESICPQGLFLDDELISEKLKQKLTTELESVQPRVRKAGAL